MDNTEDNCNPENGQCECLPHVIGKKCDQCEADYWNLNSGSGCAPCDCDVNGTHPNSTSCNHNTGECECLNSRGGRRCNECPFGYWGSPLTKCTSKSSIACFLI